MILPSPGINAAAIGERAGSSFSWVFLQPCDPGGLLPGPRLRIYLPSLLKVDHAQKSADLEGQHETKKHYKETLISPPPTHTHTRAYTDTHTQSLKCKHFLFCVSNLFYPFYLPVCSERIQSHQWKSTASS
ncbi:hypothetical protein mRhiFer1_008838 [Rhinolophus ferrumequinum]|uniref:Uncharacterized protein n=1 Tax=Rhinolophus ferrumequinum TaxID=59479 RepID=A0A7J8AFH5_RHIFE|nr:hypothetical protein mRhiFer1_008838 [Rhinolophus ferrumequinum]